MIRVAIYVAAAIAAAFGFHVLAQGSLDARLAATPIGTSSSNGISFVWFYDPSQRAVYVCRTGGAADAIDCKAKAQLP